MKSERAAVNATWRIVAAAVPANLVSTLSWFGIFTFVNAYIFHVVVWGSNNEYINASVPRRLRDSAFVIAHTSMMGAIFAVGLVHNRLLAAGISLPSVFMCCGVMGALGGTALVAYSFTRHSEKERP